MPQVNRKYGWRRDLHDSRDHPLTLALPPPEAHPPRVDLRHVFPHIYNQGNAGSCTGHSSAWVTAYAILKAHPGLAIDQAMVSRLFLYYNGRVPDGTEAYDSGAQNRNVIKGLVKLGAPHEALWPYSDEVPGPLTTKPSANAYKDALHDRAISYQRIPQTLSYLKGVLAAGFPFLFGLEVFPSFQSEEVAQTGMVPLPDPSIGDYKAIGGHSMACAGYDDTIQCFIVPNSYGEDWGDKGSCYIPYPYLVSSHGSDFWLVRVVGG